MGDIIIRAENIGKKYIIGHEVRESYTLLRDVIANKTRQIMVKTRQLMKGGQLIAGTQLEEFWALQEISFKVRLGESLGMHHG